MAQTVAYSGSDEKMHESEPEPEIDGVDPWKAAMQVCMIFYDMNEFCYDKRL